MFVGVLGLLATSVIGLQGHGYLHYWWALLLLGVGWNFLYVGGTTMLTCTYTLEERFSAQAVNEFLVFGTSATASLLAGTVIFMGYGRHLYRENALGPHRSLMAERSRAFETALLAARMRAAAGTPRTLVLPPPEGAAAQIVSVIRF